MTVLKSNNKNNENQILIFDTNIFLMGIDFNIINVKIFSVPGILEEIKVSRYLDKNRNIINRINAAIDSNKLILKVPYTKYVEKIKEVSKRTGDLKALSIVDIELIALALQFKNTTEKKVVLYTNDYSMENVCSTLNIPFAPLGKKGIKKKRLYEVYCPFCQETYSPEDLNKICEICNSKLKRRPIKREN